LVTARVTAYRHAPVSRCSLAEDLFRQVDNQTKEARKSMSILWIILIVVLVLALLGFFSRGRW
jgi:uncharacterized Rmd1/YagE family protein